MSRALVPDTAPLAGVSDGAQGFQQPLRIPGHDRAPNRRGMIISPSITFGFFLS
jgi:hypothetical protein